MVLIVTAILVFFIVLSLAQEVNRRLHVQAQIRELQTQVDSMQKHIVELQQLNEYFRTPDYKERLAREQLNYRAPGEKVVLIPENTSTASQGATKPISAATQLSTPLKWWYVFFVNSKQS